MAAPEITSGERVPSAEPAVRRRARGDRSRLFHPIPDPAEHPLAHHEASHLDRLHQGSCPPSRVPISLPHKKPGCPVRALPQHEGPGEVVGRCCIPDRNAPTDDEPPLGRQACNLQRHVRMEIDLVSDLDVLLLGHDAISAVDVAAHEVLEAVIAIEPATPLPKLGEPWPDLVHRCADGDGPGRGEIGSHDEVIPGERVIELIVSRTPSELPLPPQQHVSERCTADDACVLASMSHPAFLERPSGCINSRGPRWGGRPRCELSGAHRIRMRVASERPRSTVRSAAGPSRVRLGQRKAGRYVSPTSGLRPLTRSLGVVRGVSRKAHSRAKKSALTAMAADHVTRGGDCAEPASQAIRPQDESDRDSVASLGNSGIDDKRYAVLPNRSPRRVARIDLGALV